MLWMTPSIYSSDFWVEFDCPGPYTVPALSLHCPYTVPTLSLHCLYTVPTLSIHCPYTVPALSLHCPYTVPTLSLHCPYTVPTLSLHCPYTVPTLSLHCPYTVPTLSLHCPYTVPTLSLHCPYTVPTLSLHCPYTVPTLDYYRDRDDKLSLCEVESLVWRLDCFLSLDQSNSQLSLASVLARLGQTAGEAQEVVFSLQRFLQPVLVTLPRYFESDCRILCHCAVVRAVLQSLLLTADTNADGGMDWQELQDFSDFHLVVNVWPEMKEHAEKMQNVKVCTSEEERTCFPVLYGWRLMRFVTCHLSHVSFHMSHVSFHMSHVTCHMSPCHLSPCHLSPVTCHLSPVTCHLSPVTCLLSPITYHLSPPQLPTDTRRPVQHTPEHSLWPRIPVSPEQLLLEPAVVTVVWLLLRIVARNVLQCFIRVIQSYIL